MILTGTNQRSYTAVAAIAFVLVVFHAFHHSGNTQDGVEIPIAKAADTPAAVAEVPAPVAEMSASLPVPTPSVEIEDRLMIKDKVAVIVETRILNTLLPLVMHFAAVLGPSWPILLYTSAELKYELEEAAAFVRYSHQIEVRPLLNETTFTTHGSVNTFMTQPWLWEELAPAEHVLLFQSDSMICANSEKSADDFLGWDIIGAPIDAVHGKGFNGGLSIRNRKKVLEILSLWSFAFDSVNFAYDNRWDVKWEDQWMAWRMSQLSGANLPPPEIAMKFAVETMYYDSPFGYHQPSRWQPAHMEDIKVWCPEVNLLIGAEWTN